MGASAAGLASEACLQKEGTGYIILEKYPQVAANWRNHYDRLHLHTSKKWSGLPFIPFDRSLPQYPSRQDVVNYLDDYAKKLNVHPVFDTKVLSVKKEEGYWVSETANGTYKSKFVIVATGMNHKPILPV